MRRPRKTAIHAFGFAVAFLIGTASAHADLRKIVCGSALRRGLDSVIAPADSVRELVDRWRTAARWERFDFAIYETERAAFAADPTRVPTHGLVEEKLAYLDARLRRLGATELSVDGILKREGEWSRKRKLLRLVEDARFPDPAAGWTGRRVDRVFDALYAIEGISLEPSILDLLDRDSRSAIERKLRAHVETKIRKHGLRRWLANESRLLPPTGVERIGAILRSNAFSWLVSALTNLGIARGQLGILPKIAWFRISPETMRIATEEGIDAAWDRILREAGPGFRRQAYYDAFARAYRIAGAVAFLVMVEREIERAIDTAKERVKREEEELARAEAALKERTEALRREVESESAKSSGQRLFEGWIADYRNAHGGAAPDSLSEEYRTMREVFLGPSR